MKTLVSKAIDDDYEFDQHDDVDRIVRVCKQRGFEISPEEARKAWERRSDMFAATWLALPEEDSDLFNCVMRECVEVSK